MANAPLSERQRAALRELVQQAATRARAEEEIDAAFRAGSDAAEQEQGQACERLQAQFEAARAAAERERDEARTTLTAQFELDHRAAAQEYSAAKHRANYLHTTAKEKIEADFKESRWTLTTLYDSDKKVAKEQYAKTKHKIDTTLTRIEALYQDSFHLLIRWNMADLNPPINEQPALGEADPFKALQQCATTAENSLEGLKSLTIPRLLLGTRFPLLVLVLWVLATAPAFLIDEWYYWVLGSSAIAVILGVMAHAWLTQRGRRQAAVLYQAVNQALADAKVLSRTCHDLARATYKGQRAASKKQAEQSLKQAVRHCRTQLKEIAARRQQDRQQAKKTHVPLLAELIQRRAADLDRVETAFQQRMEKLNADQDEEQAQLANQFALRRDDVNHRHANAWAHMAGAWKQAVEAFADVVRRIDADCRGRFAAWEDAGWLKWQPPTTVPLGIRFGALDVSPATIPHALPADPHLPRLQLRDLTFPALLHFPERASLLLKAGEEGRGAAVEVLQAVMLRFLTGLPPGKLRFTIVDPVGRGENFAAFMHLADYDELLITSRIWTESSHIDQRLADLTTHMENVIQKYLRNQFQTLEEYNVQAGEVAEPYRLLVVANFPTNFSPESARRLLSLAASGARCGIYTLITVDTRQPLPQGFELADLERACLTLTWQDKAFLWNDADFRTYPLTLDPPPDAEQCTQLMHVVGKQAKLANRVEVPFEFVAPVPEAWWSGDSRGGIAVPLGRAGALQRQFFTLGQGTAQHALVAGKTGSGKSTLLHALITQIALHYSPDEVELYLVDFKKGVEFKTYATHELPHARVVAVESEREFGLSVLQRLDAELKQRGERFRQAGVSDLNAFRQMEPSTNGHKAGQTSEVWKTSEVSACMPRIMLIVDEFQEFFVEDDKIAQESALLLDRLVRQGRAFGMHVLLGSQTLGGAYSLARSTIDQMAVRIALQCSEADAHLILSKDNSAARLLTRPGEAIYNAANGLLEGNNLFQVVWLPDERRDHYLRGVSELARARAKMPHTPQIVFEGTAPSDITKNALLQRLVTQAPPAPRNTWSAWLGEAIAIKDPTAAVFRKQSGANLLMIGQQAEAAFSMMAAAACSLACQQPAHGPSLFFVPGSPIEDEAEEAFTTLPDVLAPQFKPVAVRELPAVLGMLADEVERRAKGASGEPLFLLLYGLQRLRQLRREEDFGLSRRGEEKASPAKLFANILRDGAAVGVFVIAWCDNLNNLNRALDRPMLREFDMRVLFQMSAADSSNLIDSPLAAKLGAHRAIYCTEDQGRLEKFRPYGPPPAEWLRWLQTQREKQVRPVGSGLG